jgi:glycosyltransferase involved in cell wall biosynthesis
LSLGLPVIANDIGGWTKIISEHKVGILTGSEPDQFAEGFVDLLASDKRNEYAQNALGLVTEEYNWDRSGLKLIEAYKEVTS